MKEQKIIFTLIVLLLLPIFLQTVKKGQQYIDKSNNGFRLYNRNILYPNENRFNPFLVELESVYL